ncbi:cobalamin B12-binding domain-containing protein, partial [Candidatus Bathyarchaeota archaeon]|nr:cobalamin B12-binding domain-containing protein [Candidatus Bathyarchaeota archaeon]
MLVYPKTGEEKWRKTYVPPFSVLALAYWLKKHGVADIHVYDQRVEPESRFLSLLHKCSTKPIIGFSTMTGPQIVYSLDLAKKAREQCPESYIVFGGVHPSFTPETTVS